MTITCRLYRDGKLKEHEVALEEVSDYLKEPDALVWLDVDAPTRETMMSIGEEFGFHELAVEDSVKPHQRPKIEQYGDYYFLVAYGVSLSAEAGATRRRLVPHEVSAFVGANFLVTARKEPAFDIGPVVERWDAHSELAREGGGFLLYILLDEIVDGYFEVVDEYEGVVDVIEDDVLRPNAGTAVQTEIFRFKKELTEFRRLVAPLREALDVVQRRLVDVVTPELEPYYRDVYDHVLRATDFVDTLRDVTTTALEAYLSVVGNRLNEVMKSLTSWGAIILVPTLIAGIYGMNFRHMPELNWLLGYPMALGLMLVSALVLFVVFKRRGWL